MTPAFPIGLAYPASTRAACCFFFQAEDGIRYLTVTEVQTCALPIYQPDKSVGIQGARPADCSHAGPGRDFQFWQGREDRFHARAIHRHLPQRNTATGRGRNRSRRSEEHTSELQSQSNLVCRLLLEKK